MWRAGSAEVLAALALAFGALGCDPIQEIGPEQCDRSSTRDPLLYTEGVAEGGVYETSAWDEEWLEFRGGAYYRLEHHLGGTPRVVNSYLSFEPRGTHGGGAASQPAGNQVLVQCVDDSELWIINDSCVDYYLRVVAMSPENGAGGGGSGGGCP